MSSLDEAGPGFLKMAHEIVWGSVATVDRKGRPRSRVLHPIWQWDGGKLVGWVGTGPTPLKRAHLEQSPHVSINYWAPSQDTCTAECHAELLYDQPTRTMVWDLLKNGPEPVGYDPAMIPGWDDATSDSFAALRLDPWRLRVFPGSVLMGQGGEVLTWNE
jgi:hypothetical protein